MSWSEWGGVGGLLAVVLIALMLLYGAWEVLAT